MAAIYRSTLRNARMNLVLDDIDGGVEAGKLKLYNSGGGTLLANITLADPCGTVSGDVLTFTMPQSDLSADNSGDAVEATITDSDDNVIISGLTVGESAADVIVTDNTIVQLQVVQIDSATITHASS